MCKCLARLQERLEPLRVFAELKLLPIVYLVMRLMVGYDFLKSGWLKFGYVLNHQIDALYSLFDDYKVPVLPSHIAAWLGMGGEPHFRHHAGARHFRARRRRWPHFHLSGHLSH